MRGLLMSCLEDWLPDSDKTLTLRPRTFLGLTRGHPPVFAMTRPDVSVLRSAGNTHVGRRPLELRFQIGE